MVCMSRHDPVRTDVKLQANRASVASHHLDGDPAVLLGVGARNVHQFPRALDRLRRRPRRDVDEHAVHAHYLGCLYSVQRGRYSMRCAASRRGENALGTVRRALPLIRDELELQQRLALYGQQWPSFRKVVCDQLRSNQFGNLYSASRDELQSAHSWCVDAIATGKDGKNKHFRCWRQWAAEMGPAISMNVSVLTTVDVA